MTYDPRELPRICAEMALTNEWDRDGWRDAELFHVSAEMVMAARAEAAALTEMSADVHDPPAPVGLIVFDEPIGTYDGMDVTAAGWHAGGSVTLRWMVSAAEWDRHRDIPDLFADRWPSVQVPLVCMPLTLGFPLGAGWDDHRGWPMSLADERDYELHCFGESYVDMSAALWRIMRIMREERAVETRAEYTRPERRRHKRETGRDIPPVRLITLRRAHREGAGGGKAGRKLIHQHVVRGHVRRLADGREIPVRPHVKGPKGAPFLDVPKVYTLRK